MMNVCPGALLGQAFGAYRQFSLLELYERAEGLAATVVSVARRPHYSENDPTSLLKIKDIYEFATRNQ